MPRTSPNAPTLSRKVLRGLVVLNLIYGSAILVLLVASLAAEGPVMDALGVRPGDGRASLILGMRLIMVAGIASVPIAHVILTRLLAIVESVHVGDPFVPENAARLQVIAWSVLGLEVLRMVVGAIAAGASTEAQPLDIHWRFSFTPWLTVLLLFVIARVFDHGTRLRADLEGTV